MDDASSDTTAPDTGSTDPADGHGAPDLAGLRERLDAMQWHVTQEAGTEAAFTGIYWDNHEEGLYRCIVCHSPLFRSDTKFESGSGWPSFWEPVGPDAVVEVEDRTHGMSRTEIRCGTCGAHLGHVFPDGPQPTGLRYCMNSAALDLDTDAPAAPGS